MDPREMETLVARLVANPHDEDALARAHQAGQMDPQGYAALLERVAQSTTDPTFAAHWMSEAASVWDTLGNPEQQLRLLSGGADRDPTNAAVVEGLADLLAARGQHQEIVRILERSVDAWAAGMHEDPEFVGHKLAAHERLAGIYGQPPLDAPDSALRHWRAILDQDPANVLAIYSARELLKANERYAESVEYFGKEQALVDDVERKVVLYRDEAEVRRLAGDGAGRTEALRQAVQIHSDDPSLTYEYGLSVVDRLDAGEAVSPPERQDASRALLGLAEMYEGEHAMMYAVAALKALPSDDRAMQLADFHAEQLGRGAELAQAYGDYVTANPSGYMAEKARSQMSALGGAMTGAPPPLASAPILLEPSHVASPAASQPASPAASQPAAPSSPQAAAPSSPAQPSEPAPAPVAAEPSVAEASVPQLLAEAAEEAQRGRKPQAYGKFREVLDLEPANSEALSWVEDFLRQRRKFADLRDVLLAASRVSTLSDETRKAQLRDVAGLCESKLRDFETAISAWKQLCQIDRGDDAARDQLCALLEKQKRWDELAPLLEQQAMNEPDIETKISMEKKLAQLHEQRRKDPGAAAEVWLRVAELTPGDESPILTAVKLYEKGEAFDAAASVIVDWLPQIDDIEQKASLLEKLAELRVQLGDVGGAGDAYAEAADLSQKDQTYEQASDCYRQAERWADVAHITEQRALLHDGEAKAAFLAEAGQALVESGNAAAALVLFEQAADLDPGNDEHASRVEAQYLAEARQVDLAGFLSRRADALDDDEDKRVALRHRAAQIQFSVGDEEGGCDTLRLVLADREDRDALEQLYQAAERRVDHMDSVDLLQRLVKISEGAEKLGYALREAQIVGEGLEELGLAVDRYEQILQDIEPNNRIALRAIADLERRRDNPGPAAAALEKELKLAEGEERVEIAGQLAELYEGPLDDPKAAVRVLDIIHAADPEDFDAIGRLQVLSEKLEDWPRVANLLRQLIEVEGDEEEASEMTRQLASLYREKLEKGDEALGALEGLADQGDVPCQHAYVDLGIELGWKGLVAQKLLTWNEGVAGSSRAEALRKAFDLFVEAERDADARGVALDLAQSRDLDPAMAGRLEEIAAKLKDLEAMGVAHDILSADISGEDRASELVRQAEMMAAAGADAIDAIQHGEQGLAGVDPADADFLLERLATLTGVADDVLDLYERQVRRCRAPAERINALARAAQVAAERGSLDRARDFFNAALSGGVQEDTIATLESAARSGAEGKDGRALLQTLAEALAGGGQGSRDGGRTRSALLRRAAVVAHRDLDDIGRAFSWLADSIIAHVDEAALDALAQLGSDVGDMARVEAALSRALDEVFDGPLVRQLLRRRASVRKEHLNDLKGAASDMKRLHDLSPADQKLTEELSTLLTELRDHRGMIELYEDQILRGREPTARAELARKVARLWEEHIGDVREAADAWRRVLRMRSGDEEATSGLERAKARKLKRAPQRSGPPPAMDAPPARSSAGAAAPAPQVSEPPAEVASQPQAAPSVAEVMSPESADFADTEVADDPAAVAGQSADFANTALSAGESPPPAPADSQVPAPTASQPPMPPASYPPAAPVSQPPVPPASYPPAAPVSQPPVAPGSYPPAGGPGSYPPASQPPMSPVAPPVGPDGQVPAAQPPGAYPPDAAAMAGQPGQVAPYDPQAEAAFQAQQQGAWPVQPGQAVPAQPPYDPYAQGAAVPPGQPPAPQEAGWPAEQGYVQNPAGFPQDPGASQPPAYVQQAPPVQPEQVPPAAGGAYAPQDPSYGGGQPPATGPAGYPPQQPQDPPYGGGQAPAVDPAAYAGQDPYAGQAGQAAQYGQYAPSPEQGGQQPPALPGAHPPPYPGAQPAGPPAQGPAPSEPAYDLDEQDLDAIELIDDEQGDKPDGGGSGG